jgi:hypothetical protein
MRHVRFLGSCALAIIIGSALSSSASAEWLRYQDPRFGTSTLYPADLLFDRTPTETGATFSGLDGSLEISAAHRHVYSISELRRLIAGTPGYDRVTYSPQGRNWLVVSGYRGDDIFYEKYFVRDGIVEGFALEYLSSARGTFDPVVEVIEDSFRPGR